MLAIQKQLCQQASSFNIMATFTPVCGISVSKLFLVFAVVLQPFSEHTEKEATASTAEHFVIQPKAIKEVGYVADFSVFNASVRLGCFARNCMTILKYLLSLTIAGQVAGLLPSISLIQLQNFHTFICLPLSLLLSLTYLYLLFKFYSLSLHCTPVLLYTACIIPRATLSHTCLLLVQHASL